MSEVFHSAGVPGATRCSESATGTEASFPAGDALRLSLAHDCACEIDALLRLALATHNSRLDDNPLAFRGLMLRALVLTNAQVSLLSGDPLQGYELVAIRDDVRGVDAPKTEGRLWGDA